MFDNGAAPPVHEQSRGLVLKLEAQAKAVRVLQEFVRTPPLVAESEGSVQLLEDGNWFVGWGQEPYFSEYSPQGDLLFEARMPRYERSYRALHFAWYGRPAQPPAFVFRGGASGGTMYASWNGATGVTDSRVLAGASTRAMKVLATAPRSGFETAIAIPAGTAGPFLVVQALGPRGEVLRASNAVAQRGL